ncbi:MAG: sigma-70 family RNA polymerase sigma factor [Planctomycetes bacterium]|nr:sigma-70 family RNA polymerase sigma factor [Planctomycetota bacterium]
MHDAHERGDTPFLTTRWSVVVEAGRVGSPTSRAALSELCEVYWYPLYAYVRRRGYSTEDASDLTQAFFARLLEKNVVGVADPARGRFRAFLLGSLKNFLANEWDKLHAQKRGGGSRPLSLDFEIADEKFRREPTTKLTPEMEYERNWALAVLERALARLQGEYSKRGKAALFERLRSALVSAEDSDSRLAMAKDLGMTEGAVKVALHRMRGAFRESLRTEIAETVGSDRDLDDELRALIEALSHKPQVHGE